MGLADLILDLLYPPKCAFCGSLITREDRGVCPACLRDLPRTGGLNRTADFVTGVTAPLYYEGVVRSALLRYKFNGAQAGGGVYGRMIAEELRAAGKTDFDVVTWAPLSRRRLRSRGYDQARLLAESAAGELGLPCERLLRKDRHTRPQSGIDAPEARRANVSGVYIPEKGHRAEGKRVLLIDDVITTGATVSECARVLLMDGAESVYAASLAAPRRDKIQ